MDITRSRTKRYANSFMNGETVNYIISAGLSFLLLTAVKQLLKTFFGVDTTTACYIAFAAA